MHEGLTCFKDHDDSDSDKEEAEIQEALARLKAKKIEKANTTTISRPGSPLSSPAGDEDEEPPGFYSDNSDNEVSETEIEYKRTISIPAITSTTNLVKDKEFTTSTSSANLWNSPPRSTAPNKQPTHRTESEPRLLK